MFFSLNYYQIYYSEKKVSLADGKIIGMVNFTLLAASISLEFFPQRFWYSLSYVVLKRY